MRTQGKGLQPCYLVTRNRRTLLPWPEAGKPVKGTWESVITSETWAALEIHNSVPSLHLSSPPGQAPLGSFIFVLMAALDNGAAEKSQKVKTQLWHYWLSLSLSCTSEYSWRYTHAYLQPCSLNWNVFSFLCMFLKTLVGLMDCGVTTMDLLLPLLCPLPLEVPSVYGIDYTARRKTINLIYFKSPYLRTLCIK